MLVAVGSNRFVNKREGEGLYDTMASKVLGTTRDSLLGWVIASHDPNLQGL